MKTRKLNLCLILLIGLFLLNGCQSSKKPITLEEFQTYTEGKEYVFMNISEQFDYDEKVESAAMASTSVWHVEFYILDSQENAEEIFEANRLSFQETKISTSAEKEKTAYHSKTYELTTSYEFMYLCQVDNTLLFARVPVEYRSKVLSFAKGLNY